MTDTTERPLVTFAVIAYNQERFIREAIEGAFAQTYQPLEIILSDDCSPDRTYQIMQEMAAAYDGPHKVVLNRNEPNLGIAGHFNRIMEKAEGEFVLVNAGDDISLPDRTLATVKEFLQDQNLTYVETEIIRISENGLTQEKNHTTLAKKRYYLDDLLNRRLPFHGAARTYRKDTITRFPPLGARCPTEDTPTLLRCLLCGHGVFLPDAGVKWRMHADNMSSPSSLKSMPLLEIYNQYKADIQYMKATGLLSKKRSRQILGGVAYWIIRRISAQQDTKLQSRLKKIQLFFSSPWLSFMERIFVMKAILLQKRN